MKSTHVVVGRCHNHKYDFCFLTIVILKYYLTFLNFQSAHSFYVAEYADTCRSANVIPSVTLL